MAAALPRIEVGGQAVIEGVMMRSPRSFAVVCRRPGGEIVIKEDAWQPVWGGVKALRLPFLRGAIVLVESLWNGLSALSFAADQQMIETAVAPTADAPRGSCAGPCLWRGRSGHRRSRESAERRGG